MANIYIFVNIVIQFSCKSEVDEELITKLSNVVEKRQVIQGCVVSLTSFSELEACC